MKKIIALFVFTSFIQFQSYAIFEVNSNCKEAYNKIICLQFNEAQLLLTNEQVKSPDNSFRVYLENMIDFLKVFLSEDKSVFKTLHERKNSRIEIFENDPSISPWKRYVLADTYLEWAVVRLKFREFVSAAFDVSKAYDLLNENTQLYPMFFPNMKGLGVLHSVIGSVPDEYKWLLKLVSLKGSTSQGLKELLQLLKISKSDENYHFLYPECLFYLTYSTLQFQSDKKEALNLLRYYEDQKIVTESPILAVSKASIYIQNGKSADAEKTLYEVEKYASIFNLIDYQMGLAKLNQLKPDSYKYFFKFLMHFKGENLIKSAYQKIAWYYLLENNAPKYHEYMQLMFSKGETYTESDKQAMREAQLGNAPTLVLLKSRLLFDGGDYPNALSLLQNIEHSKYFSNARDVLEYSYRLARIYHEMGNTPLAISNYERTLKEGIDKPYYFVANSALQLGLIYEVKKEKAKAILYFKMCLSLSPEEYKSSLHQKARAGLLRLS